MAEVVQTNVAEALGEFGLRVEGHAKRELQKGHGVLTGTLRRSIHTAGPDYSWSGDDVEPSPSAPERGGVLAKAVKTAVGLVVQVGSGLRYALAVHQGHGSFKGYHYLRKGLNKAKKELPEVLKRHKLK
uniref:Tail protein n=2 Tax=viral metagenome TaxID=1070528 RepID=A0A6H1ZEQ8_9ZZZZ